MRGYLALATRDRAPLPPVVLEAVQASVSSCFPVPGDTVRAGSWSSPRGDVALFAWSNEPEDPHLPPLLVAGPGSAVGWTGYLTGDRAEARVGGPEDLVRVASEVGGCFGIYRAGPGGFEVADTLSRMEQVFMASTARLRVAGSRALQVHLVARADRLGRADPGVAIDPIGLHPVLRHSYFPSDDTPYDGVTALPPASVGRVADGVLTVLEQVAPPEPEDTPDRLDRFAEALVASVRPLARLDEPVVLGLSGGRDSRLLAATLVAADVPFTAISGGTDVNPDVILGGQVAKALGVEWTHNRSATHRGRIRLEHPRVRAIRTLRVAEGMVAADTNVGGSPPFVRHPAMSGSGGEILRGGYALHFPDPDPAAVARRVRNLFLNSRQLLMQEANVRAREAMQPWLDRVPEERGRVLDDLFLYYRLGRWVAPQRVGTTITTDYYHPLVDHQVVRAARGLSVEWRATEQPVYELIARMTPQLRDIPVTGHDWNFRGGHGGGSKPAQPPPTSRRRGPFGWFQRSEVRHIDWRRADPSLLARLLGPQVLKDPHGGPLFDLVRRSEATTLLAAPVANPVIALRLYSLSLLLSQRWLDPAEPAGPPEVRWRPART